VSTAEREPATAAPPPAGGPGAGAARRPRLAQTFLTPKEPLPRAVTVALGISSFGLVLGAWAIVTYGGIVEPLFLPSPGTVAQALYNMFVHEGFAHDVWASFYRIGLGFLISCAVGIPLGIAIGSFRAVQAFFEPIIGAVRYMPASAFIPLLIIWFGIANTEKVAVIFIGVFFPLTLMIADVSANIPKELVNIGYTLGASRWQVFSRVLLPASWPGVIDNMRIGLGWAWTYLIVAELVAASTGIGHVILQSSRFIQTEKIIGGIITIGVLGLLSDAGFRWLYRVLFPYAERVAR
jgi:NitT/TauT family transport system permease protein